MPNPVLSDFKELLATQEPAELGPGPRASVQPMAILTRSLDQLLKAARLHKTQSDLVRSLVLLWHDHLDASHTISQSIENVDGSYVHGIMHRREPDYGNAKYWFHRVGRHPSYGELTSRASSLLKSEDQAELLARLAPSGQWDAFAFVDACEEAAERSAGGVQHALREIQKIEFEVLLERFSGLTE